MALTGPSPARPVDEQKLAGKYPWFRAYHSSRQRVMNWLSARLMALQKGGPAGAESRQDEHGGTGLREGERMQPVRPAGGTVIEPEPAEN